MDFFNSIASIPLGYNHHSFKNAIASGRFDKGLHCRVANGLNTPSDMPKLLNNTLLRVAPKGLTEVYNSCGCGSNALENAFKAVFYRHHSNVTGRSLFTEDEINSAYNNSKPGCPDYQILTFKNSNHGRTLGALSHSHTNPIYKAGLSLIGNRIALE